MLRHGKQTHLGAIPPRLGQGRENQSSTSQVQFIQTFPQHSNLCLGWFCTEDVSLRVTSPDTLQTQELMGEFMAEEFSFPQSPSGYSSNTGQEIFFSVPVATCHHGKCCALLHLLQFSHPVPYKTSYKQGKFSY